MSPQSQTPSQDSPISSILAFAEELQTYITRFNSCDGFSLQDNVVGILNEYLEQFPLSLGSLSVSSRKKLDEKGVDLWNGCLKVTAQGDGICESIVLVRVFAFALLESGASSQGPGNIRALNIALKAARTCLENEQLDICLKVLGIAASRLDAVTKSRVDAGESEIRSVTTEYYLLRIQLSWLQGRPDIAEHLLSKVPESRTKVDEENVLETCYRIGKLALSDASYDTAAKWLGRALASSDALSRDSDLASKETRFLVLHAVVQANLHNMESNDSKSNLSNVLNILNTEYAKEFPALMMQLEIFSKDEEPNCSRYFRVLKDAIQMVELTDENLEMVISCIHKLRRWSLKFAVEACNELILERLVPSNKQAWMEQTFVTLIYILTSPGPITKDCLQIITDVVKRLTEHGKEPLSKEATHASLIFLWRSINVATSDGRIPDMERWYNVVLEQPIFQNCSFQNRAKFQRKLLASALKNSSMLLSDEILNSMREESRAALLTLYLVYKRALLVEDHQLGSELLEKFLAVDQKHLLSCAVEAEKLGKTRQAIDILQGVINDLDASEQEIKVSALFQSTICLLIKEIERCKGGIDKQGLLDKAYSVFEAALKGANTRESSSTGSMFSKTEIEWFFQNACILALENLTFPRSQQIEQLLDVSAKFATIYQKCALDPEEQTNILSHHLLCCYLRSLKTVSEVRGQCDANEKKIHYETIRAAIQSFRERISSQLNNERITVKERTAWVVKHREMLYFDFEAAIYLKQWNSLASLVDEARPIITDKLCSNFMESILISNAPMRVTLRVVKAIICTHHKTFTAKLPRYLHVLFRLALSPNGDIIVAEAVIDQVLALARQSNSTSTSQNARARFQDEELAWLATTAFNRAVDFYRDSADADCARWAGKAIEVADLVGCDEGPGGGGLAALLRRNLGLLGLDGA